MNLPPDVDTSAAHAYESFLVPGVMAPWAETIVSQMHISRGMHVLDVACGTGIAARHAARRVGTSGRIVGVDIDQGMLAVARTVSIKEGADIEYVYASACELPFESEAFDAALCLQGLQYLPDPLKAISEVRRVLRNDSVLVSVTWSEIENCKGHWAIVSALERRNIDAAAVRKPFARANGAELHSLALEAGFKDVSIRTAQQLGRFPSAASFVDAMLRGATSSRYALEKLPRNEWPNFLAEVNDELAQWSSPAGIEFPMESNVLTARG